MTITKEYCDRCGKEIANSEINPLYQIWKSFPIRISRPKYGFINTNRKGAEDGEYDKRIQVVVCKDCLDQFWDWYNQK